MQKGQTSIEFLLILVVMLIFILTMIQPILSSSIATVKEVSSLALAKTAAEKISQNINFVALNSADAAIEINIYLPKETTLRCDPDKKRIFFSSKISLPHESCESDEDNNSQICTKSISLLSIANINCNAFGANGVLYSTTNSLYTVNIHKAGGLIYVSLK